MDKVQVLEEILRQIDLLDYKQDSAKYIRVGSFKVKETDDGDWEVTGQGLSGWFSTRTAALGYAKCIMNKDFKTATKIIMLDHEIAQKKSHEASILGALKHNEYIEPKLQQVQDKRRENMNELVNLVLNIL